MNYKDTYNDWLQNPYGVCAIEPFCPRYFPGQAHCIIQRSLSKSGCADARNKIAVLLILPMERILRSIR